MALREDLELAEFQEKLAWQVAEWLPLQLARDVGELSTATSDRFRASSAALLGEESRKVLKAFGLLHWDESAQFPQVLHWTDFGNAVGKAALELHPKE